MHAMYYAKVHAVDRLRVKLNRTTTFFYYIHLVLIEKQARRVAERETNHQCIRVVTIYHHNPLHVHPLF